LTPEVWQLVREVGSFAVIVWLLVVGLAQSKQTIERNTTAIQDHTNTVQNLSSLVQEMRSELNRIRNSTETEVKNE
jgi:uncharacterized membrane protein